MNKKIDNIGLFLQLYLAGLTVITFIIAVYTSMFYDLIYVLIAAIMFVQSYNNYKIYKRKNMTYVYIIAGVLLLFLGIVSAK